MDTLNKKIVTLNESNNNLNHNYKNIIKSHRILVDNFRSLLNAKKEKEALAAKESQMKAAAAAVKPISKNTTNTRALSENLRKKSVDQNHHILKTLASSTNKITLVKAHDEKNKQEFASLIETERLNKTLATATDGPSNIYKIVVRQDEILNEEKCID